MTSESSEVGGGFLTACRLAPPQAPVPLPALSGLPGQFVDQPGGTAHNNRHHDQLQEKHHSASPSRLVSAGFIGTGPRPMKNSSLFCGRNRQSGCVRGESPPCGLEAARRQHGPHLHRPGLIRRILHLLPAVRHPGIRCGFFSTQEKAASEKPASPRLRACGVRSWDTVRW